MNMFSILFDTKHFRCEGKGFKVIGRTTDDFGCTTEIGINRQGLVAVHKYNHSETGEPVDHEKFILNKDNKITIF